MDDTKTIELIWAGIFGMLTTLVGAVVAYWLTTADRTRSEKREAHAILRLIVIELEALLPRLDTKEGTPKLQTSAFDLLRTKGLSDTVPTALLGQLTTIDTYLHEINECLDGMRATIYAFTAAKNIENFHVSDFRQIIDPLRDSCAHAIREALPQIRAIIE